MRRIIRAIEKVTGTRVTLPKRQRDEPRLAQFLKQLPAFDYDVFRHFKSGHKRHEVAQIMGVNVEAVTRSLVRTYADLGAWTRPGPDGGESGSATREPGGGEGCLSKHRCSDDPVHHLRDLNQLVGR